MSLQLSSCYTDGDVKTSSFVEDVSLWELCLANKMANTDGWPFYSLTP